MIARSFPVRILFAAVLLLTGTSTIMAQSGGRAELTVFAASSLTEVFRALAQEFRSRHSSVSIRFNNAGSQQLLQQIIHGAAFDVFAPANPRQMQEAVRSGRVDTATVRVFAKNRLTVVLPKDNPGRISSLEDLARPGKKIILADRSVPAGQYALDVLTRCARSGEFSTGFQEQVLRNVVSYEENVRAVLAKVILGEADAGIVYTSDVARDSARSVRFVEIPERFNVTAEYAVGIAQDTRVPGVAGDFVAFVCSGSGQAVLPRFGFLGAEK